MTSTLASSARASRSARCLTADDARPMPRRSPCSHTSSGCANSAAIVEPSARRSRSTTNRCRSSAILTADAYTYPVQTADALVPLVIVPNTPMTNRGRCGCRRRGAAQTDATLAQARRDLTVAANADLDAIPASTPASRRVSPAAAGSSRWLGASDAATARRGRRRGLLIACINIANLILGRAHRLARVNLRCAPRLGGSPGRVRQQVLTESLVLAVDRRCARRRSSRRCSRMR